MAYGQHTPRANRAAMLAGVFALHGLAGWALVSGFAVDVTKSVGAALTVVRFDAPPVPPAPPPPPEARPEPEQREEGAASPENRTGRAAQITAPERRVVLPVKPVVPVADAPGTGSDEQTGSGDIAGPGTGAGGVGQGTGAGGSGSGDGGSAMVRGARKIAGEIRRSDARGERMQGSVSVVFRVLPTGRVTNCRVRGSSGNPALDALTCKLITERFRYEPAVNARGEPMGDLAGWRQDWWLERGGRRVGE